jgi:glycosyltransferase involved in cell wall biosynthesis
MEKTSDTLVRSSSPRGRESGPHVVFANYFYEPDLKTPEKLLERYSTIRPIASALRDEGPQVTVIQRFHKNATVNDDGVHFKFCADHCTPDLRKWQFPHSFHNAIRDACTSSFESMKTVVHVHGLFYPLQARVLRNKIPADCAILVQHHAERPWKGLRRHLQKWGLGSVDGFFFAARKLADDWIDCGLIRDRQRVYEVMEGSNYFRRKDRTIARARTGLKGDPVVLWVGNLTANKDPLTVLAGFEQIHSQILGARLYMAYRETQLLRSVRDHIASSPTLRDAVSLLGNVAHAELEDIYNSADYFVLGSHYEGSGFALAEAMACGVVPVVTAIPSFLAMTDDGRIGGCWTAGDSTSFASTFIRVCSHRVEGISGQVSNFFERRLSYRAIARTSLQAYEELVSRRIQAQR